MSAPVSRSRDDDDQLDSHIAATSALNGPYSSQRKAMAGSEAQVNGVPAVEGVEATRLKHLDLSRAHLQAPLKVPTTPLSPDAISNLSVEDFDYFPVQETRRPARIPSTLRERLTAQWSRNQGLFYILIAQVFGTLMNVTTRLLEIEGNNGKGLDPFQILFARMSISVVLASAYMWYKKTPHFPFGAPEIRWLLVARGFCGFFGVFGMYYSLLYLPLADATVITFLSPSLACYACSVLLKEPFTRVEQLAGVVSLAGVVLIARPTAIFAAAMGSTADAIADAGAAMNGTVPGNAMDYESVTPGQRLSAVAVAMLGVLGAAGAYTTIRWIGKRAYPLITINYFASFSTMFSIFGQLVWPGVGFLLPANLWDWTLLTFLGTCGFLMQFLLVLGLSHEKSSRSTNMMYTQMLFALTFDKLIFDHTPGWISLLGSSLILGSAIVVAIQQKSSRAKAAEATAAPDEESQQGLLHNSEQEGNDITETPIQLRALR